MKNIKCPICGTAYTLSTYGFPEKIEAYRFECEECDYGFDRRESYEEAVSIAKKFISEFPPIMRVEQGDNLKLTYADDVSTVVDKDLSCMRIFAQTVYGNIERVSCEEVEKWPWELEQKGGSND